MNITSISSRQQMTPARRIAPLVLAAALMLTGTAYGQDLRLQVLGSGGPEIDDGRASTGYLVFVDEKARALVDLGPGVARNFEQTDAQIQDLDILLLSHLHVDHSADLPAIVKGLFFSRRTRPFLIAGPGAGTWFPDVTEFVASLFSETKSAYPYLSDYLSTATRDHLETIIASDNWKREVGKDLFVTAASVNHGKVPALAWRIDVGRKSIVFSGDFSGSSGHLRTLAMGADILVCHNAIPEEASGIARRLHAPPSIIGETAQAAQVKMLILSHRMKRSTGNENETLQIIRQHYQGPVVFAEDLDSFKI